MESGGTTNQSIDATTSVPKCKHFQQLTTFIASSTYTCPYSLNMLQIWTSRNIVRNAYILKWRVNVSEDIVFFVTVSEDIILSQLRQCSHKTQQPHGQKISVQNTRFRSINIQFLDRLLLILSVCHNRNKHFFTDRRSEQNSFIDTLPHMRMKTISVC